MRKTVVSWMAVLSGASLLALTAHPAGAALKVVGKPTTATVSTSSESVVLADVALSADGSRATALWMSAQDGSYRIRSASATISAAGATWGTPRTLATSSIAFEFVDVDVSAAGTVALATWSGDTQTTYQVAASIAAVSGTNAVWDTAATLSDTAVDGQSPRAAMSTDGTTASVAWNDIRDTGWSVQVATARIASGSATWGSANRLWTPSGQSPYDEYIGDLTARVAGSAITLAWSYRTDASTVLVQSVRGTTSGSTTTWGTIRTIATSSLPVQGLDLAASATRATVVWTETDEATTYSLRAATSDATGSWGTPIAVAPEQAFPFAAGVAQAANGTRGVLTWLSPSTDNFGDPATSVVVAVATYTGTSVSLSPPEEVSEEESNNIQPRIESAADGTRVVMSWLMRTGSVWVPRDRAMFAAFTVDGTDISPVDRWALTSRSVHAMSPQVHASADAARAIAIWLKDDSNDLLQSGSANLEYRGSPRVASVSPSSGPVDGGNVVTITGENFYDIAEVWFGFDEAEDFTVVSPTTIRATVPEGDEAGKVSVTVVTDTGIETKRNLAYGYVKLADPTITSVTPAVGGLAGGAEVTIKGTRLTRIRDVFFGKEDAAIVEYVSANEIVVEIPPAKSLGPVAITIKTTAGSVTRPAAFTYVTVPAKPTGVEAVQSGRTLTVNWDAPSGVVRGYVITCTKGDVEVTRQVSAGKDTVDLPVPAGKGTFECSVAATGPGGAMGQFSRPDRAIRR